MESVDKVILKVNVNKRTDIHSQDTSATVFSSPVSWLKKGMKVLISPSLFNSGVIKCIDGVNYLFADKMSLDSYVLGELKEHGSKLDVFEHNLKLLKPIEREIEDKQMYREGDSNTEYLTNVGVCPTTNFKYSFKDFNDLPVKFKGNPYFFVPKKELTCILN